MASLNQINGFKSIHEAKISNSNHTVFPEHWQLNPGLAWEEHEGRDQDPAVAKMTTVLFGCSEVELYLTTFINRNYFR